MSVIDDFIKIENVCYPSSNLSATDELLIVHSFCSILSPPSGTRQNRVQGDIDQLLMWVADVGERIEQQERGISRTSVGELNKPVRILSLSL